MFRWFWLGMFLLSFVLLVGEGRAESVRLICNTEESANTIDAAMTEGAERMKAILRPFFQLGKCQYLAEKMSAYVAHRGTSYETTSKVIVVGLSKKSGEFPEMWTVMSAAELVDDGTI